jgi:hypothetical protein
VPQRLSILHCFEAILKWIFLIKKNEMDPIYEDSTLLGYKTISPGAFSSTPIVPYKNCSIASSMTIEHPL